MPYVRYTIVRKALCHGACNHNSKQQHTGSDKVEMKTRDSAVTLARGRSLVERFGACSALKLWAR